MVLQLLQPEVQLQLPSEPPPEEEEEEEVRLVSSVPGTRLKVLR